MKTLLIVRPQNRQAEDLAICAAYGWIGIPFAPIKIEPLTNTLFRLPAQLATAKVVFWASPTAAEIGAYACSGSLNNLPAIHVAVGKATAAKLRELGAIEVICAENGQDSEAVLTLPLWARLPEKSEILLVRGTNGRDFLRQQLLARHFVVNSAEIYQRVPKALDWTVFQSSYPQAAWVTSRQLAEELFHQVPLELAQTLQSLLYFTHHERIALALKQLGAKHIRMVCELSDAFQFLN